MKKALFIAEKGSLRRSVEEVYNKHKASIPYDITFMEQRGHLLTLKSPSELDENLKAWSWNTLPIHPEEHGGWQYKIVEEKKVGNFPTSKERYMKIKNELKENSYDYIINAGDADQEGELLVRIVIASLGVKLPILRYWSNDSTEKGILEALQNLKDDLRDPMLVNLLSAAYLRQHSDYRFGMNISRAATLKMNHTVACGRVKTPILAMICKREQEIKDFKPTTSYGVMAVYNESEKFTGTMVNLEDTEGGEEEDEQSKGVIWFDNKAEAEDLISNLGNRARVESFQTKRNETYAPKLYKLATAQADAGKFGLTASETLATIQSLYEKGYMSYPRTDCEYISSNEDFESILKAVHKNPELSEYVEMIDTDIFPKVKKTKKWVNDKEKEKSGHTALIPTYKAPDYNTLSPEEIKVYTMISRRFVAIFLPPLVQDNTTLITDIDGNTFRSTGKTVIDPGYSIIFNTKFTDTQIPVCNEGDTITVENYNVTENVTKCPKRFTDATLIMTCESPHKYLEDMSYKSLGKNLTIGTPATRASIIEELIEKDHYLERHTEKKTSYIVPTELGSSIYDNLKGCDICKIDMTGEWEIMLEGIRQGEVDPREMEEKMKKDVVSMINDIRETEMTPLSDSSRTPICTCPSCGGDIMQSAKRYYCSNYKDGCEMGAFNKICDSKITPAEIIKLLNGEEIVKKISNKGNSWMQKLTYNFDTHKVDFVKSEGKGKAEPVESEYCCPNCGNVLEETPVNIQCPSCSFKLWKSVGLKKKMLTEDQIRNFFEEGDTGLITGITSKNGNTYSAHIVLKADRSGTEFSYEN